MRSRTTLLCGTMFTVLLVLQVTPGVMGAAGGGPVCEPGGRAAGAPGVGDPYYPLYGNGGYDVRHYDLSVRYDPGTDRLKGVAIITAVATQRLACFNLDLVGLTVREVAVDGRVAAWSRTDHELTVIPRHAVNDGGRFRVVVRYGGSPLMFTDPLAGLAYGFTDTDDGALVVGEPEVAASWFPVNDHPVDRARYTFRITVPDGYDVVANGLPRRITSRGRWTTHVWRAKDPMISYLATFDVGEWDIRTSETTSGLPVIDAVDPDLGTLADASLARQPEIVSFLEDNFGPYPFETVGAIVDDSKDLWFALETQTRPIYPRYAFKHRWGDYFLVHELAHQWYGDLVALGRWRDIWLNEGFATYAEWLWTEHEDVGTPQEILGAIYAEIPADDPFWEVAIGDPGPLYLFHEATYIRGGMTLQALRNEVGDAAFWEILRAWADEHAFGTGTTPELVELAERVSGLDLDGLFETWLFTPEKPPASAVAASASRAEPPSPRVARWARAWRELVERRVATG